jgi:hypothetical protein
MKGFHEVVGTLVSGAVTDRELYDGLAKRQKLLLDSGGVEAIDSDEYQRLWRLIEELKRLHGGYVPGTEPANFFPPEGMVA